MVYKVGSMTLESVMEELSGSVNNISVCRRVDVSGDAGSYYTLHVIHDHTTAKKVIDVFEASPNPETEKIRENFGGDKDNFIVVFDYVKPRPLMNFFMGEEKELADCENILKEIVTKCISTKLPYPILYLILKQRKINIEQDGSISFDMAINFKDINPAIKERSCAIALAALLSDLLSQQKKKDALSLKLIKNKIARGNYSSFRELYVDLSMSAKSREPMKLSERWERLKRLYGDKVVKTVFVLSVVLFIVMVVMFLSNVIWSDIPFFRLFKYSFDLIGTENLTL